MSQLSAVSPIDGRYFEQTKALSPYFSEHALFKYRVFVEIPRYFGIVTDTPVKSYGLDDKSDWLYRFYPSFFQKGQ